MQLMNNTDRLITVLFVMGLSVFATAANPGQHVGHFVDSDGVHHHTAAIQYEISPIEILSYLYREERGVLADQTIHDIIPSNATPHTGTIFEADASVTILLVTAVSGVIVAISMRTIPVRTVATNDAGSCRYENHFAESFGRLFCVRPHKPGPKVPGIFMVLFFILFLFSYFLPESYAILDSTQMIGDADIPALAQGDGFGSSVAGIGDLDGDGVDDIAVGARDDDGGDTDTGAVHILFMNADGSVKRTVEINGETQNGPVLSFLDGFGSSVAGIGDLNNDGVVDIAVGATGDAGMESNTGAVHILFMNADGSVKRTAEINDRTENGPVLTDGDIFGSSVADIGDLDGDGVDDIAVGTEGFDSFTGAVHILFMNTDGSVKRIAVINDETENAPALLPLDGFGSSVTGLDDLNNDGVGDIAVGAFGDSFGIGTVHILFMSTDGSIKETVKINGEIENGPVVSEFDFFGESITSVDDLNGDGVDDIIVGGHGDVDAEQNTGSIYILFMDMDGGVKGTIKINNMTSNIPVPSADDLFSTSVANIGDLNGDGISDIAVGAPGVDGIGDSTGVGAIHIIYLDISRTNGNGKVDGTTKIDDSTQNIPELSEFDLFGASVARIGDLDGDGIDDIAVGVRGVDRFAGAVHILFMNTDGGVKRTAEINNGTSNVPVLSISDAFGSSVAGIGDLDGDGVGDIAVGARGYDRFTGAVYILFMNTNGSVKDSVGINDVTENGPELSTLDFFGSSVAGIGDLDGDGVDDIAVGAQENEASSTDTGSVHILFMDTDGSVRNTVVINNATENGPVLTDVDGFGSSVADIGDLNGDGIGDIAVGASGDDGAAQDAGTVHILFMDTDGSVKDTVELINGMENEPELSPFALFGSSVAGIGDLDGDGVDDIAVGARENDNGSVNTGTIHILFMDTDGSIKRISEINSRTENGPVLSADDNFGSSVASIGDLNNDGVVDIAVGARTITAIGALHVINLDKNTVVRSVSSPNDDGMYGTDDAIDVIVRFSEPVDVEGNPYLLLETGAIDRTAAYLSGSGTETITLRYSVLPGDNSDDLEYVAGSQLVLNGGTIKASESPNQDAIPVLPAAGNFFEFRPADAFGSLGLNKDLVVRGDLSISDSVVPDDVVGGMVAVSISDSVVPTDDTVVEISISASDSVVPDDVVGGMGSAFVSDSVTPTDGITAALWVSVSDSVAPNDAVDGMGSISVTDSVVPTDMVSGMGMVSESDSVAPTDGITAALLVSVSDSVMPDDTVDGMGFISVIDSVVSTDRTDMMLSAALSASDSVVPTDIIGGMRSISVTDSVVPTDTVSGMGMISESDSVVPNDGTTAALSVSVLDSVAPDDTVGGMGSISVTDSVVTSDNVNMMLFAALSASDSVVPTDTVSGMGMVSELDSVLPTDGTTVELSVSVLDSVTPDDTVGGMGSISVTDSVVPTDTVSGMGMVSESDSVVPTDGITTALSVSVSDSIVPDDTVGGMGSISVTDSVVPTDTVSGMGMVSESDSVVPTDRTTTALSVSVLDSVAPNDTVGGMGSISVTDSVVPTDNVDMMLSASLSALDSVVSSDSIGGMGVTSVRDSVVSSDGATMQISALVSASDSVVPSDVVGGMGSISTSDSAVPFDDATMQLSALISASDSIVPSDSIGGMGVASVRDSVVPSDGTTTLLSALISASDSVISSDSIGGMGSISASDSAVSSDNTVMMLSISTSDSIAPSDSIGGMGVASVRDSVVPSDGATMQLSAFVSASDSVIPSDVVGGMGAISASDSIVPSDGTALMLSAIIPASDSVVPSDSISGMGVASVRDSVVPSDETTMMLSTPIFASDSVAPSDVVDGMGSVLGSDSVTPSDQITRSLSISILASDSVTPDDMIGAPPEPEPIPVPAPEPEQIRSSAPRTSSGGTGFALAPALMLYDRCDDKNELVVIGATYGENLQATIGSGNTYIAGNDITSKTNFANYIEHHNIPVNLHAFEFEGAPYAIDAITVHDDKKEYTVPASFGNTCNGHTILYEPLSVMFKTHIEFGSRYGFVQSQDVGNVESVTPDVRPDVTTSNEEAIVSEPVGMDSEPAEVDPEPIVSESVATDPEPAVVSEPIGTDPEPEEVDPEPTTTQRPIWESVMEFFASLIP